MTATLMNWKKTEWIFEKDGALRDIYIQNTTIADWKKVVDLLNAEYKLIFGNNEEDPTDKIDFKFVEAMFADKTGELVAKSATIDLSGIIVKCHFFVEEQIEFDINGSEINSKMDFEKLVDFMKKISAKLEKQIILCGENEVEFPLMKIDVKNAIEKILTEKEAENLFKSTFVKSCLPKFLRKKY